MRLALRLGLIASLVLVVLLLVLKSQIEDRWDQYGVGSYIRHKAATTFKDGTLDYLPPLPGITGDKVIVMAKLENDDTRWATEELSEYICLISSRIRHSLLMHTI